MLTLKVSIDFPIGALKFKSAKAKLEFIKTLKNWESQLTLENPLVEVTVEEDPNSIWRVTPPKGIFYAGEMSYANAKALLSKRESYETLGWKFEEKKITIKVFRLTKFGENYNYHDLTSFWGWLITLQQAKCYFDKHTLSFFEDAYAQFRANCKKENKLI